MRVGPTEILDTYAEAFRACYARIIITAADEFWLAAALNALTGYGTSVIGCDAEVGVERNLTPGESPDDRPAAAVLLFSFTVEELALAVGNRVGQCVLTCPTTACFNGLTDASETIPLGDHVRFFGDGHERQESRAKCQEPDLRLSTLNSRLSTSWTIPVMDGEFLVDRVAGVARGVAGGNIILQAKSQAAGLAAARRAAAAVAPLAGVITPFPGGVCRSGSKVGSKYKSLVASTHEAFCPTLRDRVDSQLVDGATVAYEIIIDGIDPPAVEAAMRAAIEAAAGEGVLAIGAGNYGGKLGQICFQLSELLS
jgi:formylmethanofuran--tetrahydromethanopterin N-formyltransferase